MPSIRAADANAHCDDEATVLDSFSLAQNGIQGDGQTF
jgi:hypothetical protein